MPYRVFTTTAIRSSYRHIDNLYLSGKLARVTHNAAKHNAIYAKAVGLMRILWDN
jgi:hypothetical protein